MTFRETNHFSKILLAFALLSLFAFCSCSDEQAQMEISRLQAENEGLRAQIDSLESVLTTKQAQGDSVKKSLQSLDMGI
ncbi:hypothetical protein [Fibrobacter sp. UWEL]|uniref:hypothetical protein n=1 Tax=Fibrobacter sp. UWEL TaxID=1896209 RepID=UPI00091AB3F0|nr:hypothetical protein [Fibrobacter sp. UWEL]SHK38306.1 hypothetical protein SAMN05720468_101274 [Fibrobacter sp. UWEL]